MSNNIIEPTSNALHPDAVALLTSSAKLKANILRELKELSEIAGNHPTDQRGKFMQRGYGTIKMLAATGASDVAIYTLLGSKAQAEKLIDIIESLNRDIGSATLELRDELNKYSAKAQNPIDAAGLIGLGNLLYGSLPTNYMSNPAKQGHATT